MFKISSGGPLCPLLLYLNSRLYTFTFKNLCEYGDKQADAGRDCRTRLARPKLSGANADREIFILPVQLTTCRIGNLTRLIRINSCYVCAHSVNTTEDT